MIRIVIGNKDVVLSDDMTFDFIRENAMLTKASDYTYDIDIDLRIPANKQLYSHIDRINSSNRPTDRIAEIWDNNKLLVRGTEAILKVEGYKAKIQILANNSALNYAFDDNVKVRDLDFGSCETRDTASAKALLNKCYGDNDNTVHECYPVVKIGDTVYNVWSEYSDDEGPADDEGYTYKDDDNLRPMPFVLFLMEKLLEVLGYSIGINHITADKYRYLCLIHGYDTDEYAKMLPNWTVREMIEEYEKFFNVVFFFNSIDKVVDILSVDTFYQTVGDEFVGVDDVIDEHDCDYKSSEDEVQVSYKNVGYKLPSSEYWKFQNISKDIYDMCTHETLAMRYTHEYNRTDMVIYTDPNRKCEWIHWEEAGGATEDEATHKHTLIVNQFRDYIEDENVSRTELRLIPAQTPCLVVGGGIGYRFSAPVVESTEMGTGYFSDIIRGAEDALVDTMQVAFYIGLANVRGLDGNPQGFGKSYPSARCAWWIQEENVVWKGDSENGGNQLHCDYNRSWTFELCGEYGRAASELNNAVYVDTAKLYTIKFKTRKFLDPRKKFVIANRLWYCKQLKYKVERGGVDVIVEGEFYPAKTLSI